jgi:hypothetical protein
MGGALCFSYINLHKNQAWMAKGQHIHTSSSETKERLKARGTPLVPLHTSATTLLDPHFLDHDAVQPTNLTHVLMFRYA